MNTNQDLETLTRNILKLIENMDDEIKITDDFFIKDLKNITEKQLCFIDYCKFEFGEGVTEGK